MKPGLKIAVVLTALAGLLTQFNNCEVYSNSSVLSSSGAACTGNGCVSSSAEMIEIGAPIEVRESSAANNFDLGGDCNEGLFPENTLNWQIVSSGVVISDCKALMTCGKCKKGRYQIRPSFPPATVLSQYPGAQIVLELIGIDQTGTQYPGRAAMAKRQVNIQSL